MDVFLTLALKTVHIFLAFKLNFTRSGGGKAGGWILVLVSLLGAVSVCHLDRKGKRLQLALTGC